MNMLQAFPDFYLLIKKQLAAKLNPTIILGFSGGPDSTFLFHILRELHHQGTINLIAAHLNHEWRETAADDEAFCRTLAAEHTILFERACRTDLESHVIATGSSEDLGRRMRLLFFKQLNQKHNADYIALAHHHDDQIETFFTKLARGTSLYGLGGMRPHQSIYWRPLLATPKKKIINFMMKHNLPYCTDATNLGGDNLRSRIRRHLAPQLATIDKRMTHKIVSTMQHLRDAEDALHTITEDLFGKVFITEGTNRIGSLGLFKEQHLTLQKRLILMWLECAHQMRQPHDGLLNEIIRFLLSPRGGIHTIDRDLSIAKKGKQFWIV